MDIKAQLNNIRISPPKVREVTHLLRGQMVSDAIVYAEHDAKRAGLPIAKLLRSAIANAVHNHKMSEENLIVRDIIVGAGPTLKRSMPRAYGRATPILKRTSKIVVILSEKVEKKEKQEKITKKTAKKITQKTAKKATVKKTTKKAVKKATKSTTK